MLSFQIKDAETINIICDAEGMSVLLAALAKLIGERASHVHLRGGNGNADLDLKTPFGEDAVSEVVIDYAEHGSS